MNRDIVFIDLESTGVSVTGDRICQIAALKVTPELEIVGEVKNYLINPGIPIPKEATEIHGITDDMVKDQPTFKSRSRALHGFLDGCDISGFNSTRFDVPMLAEEFARVGLLFPAAGTNLPDVMQIFHAEEKRDLAAAFMFYCHKIIINAHDAKADILATFEVYKAQLLKYPHLAGLNAHQIDQLYGGNIRVDLGGAIVLNDKGVAVYNIGKDKGKSIVENPGFGLWMLKQDFASDTKAILTKLLNLK